MGFFFGGPLGAILGTAVGHSFDKAKAAGNGRGYLGAGESERVQMAFFTATFSVMGHLAKADGRVSDEEIAAVRKIMVHMQLTGEQQQTAINLFNEGKRPDFPLDDILEQFRRECHGRSTLKRVFLEILLGAAMADGVIHDSELDILSYVCERVGYPRAQFERIVEMMRAGQKAGGTTGFDRTDGVAATTHLRDAYGVLGLSEDAPDDDVKRAYRHLMTQYHPDKLVSKGLPDEMMQFATEKTRDIKAAYELIRESRRLH